MTYEPLKMVREFNQKFGVTSWIEEPDSWSRKKKALLNLSLIEEEFREVADELLDVSNANGSVVNLAKELVDLLYVTYQAAAIFEIDVEKLFKAVHENNLTKLGADGKPVLRPSDGKILKPPGYVPVDVHSVLYGESD